jgi:phosphoglycolate phosphatase-like HAD superfamily hydrolase
MQTLIFDLDGDLVGTANGHVPARQQALKERTWAFQTDSFIRKSVSHPTV